MGTGTHKGMAAIGGWAAVAGVCAVLGGSAFGQASFEVLTDTLGAYDATDDASTLVGASFDGDCSLTYDNASIWTQATGWKWLEGVCGMWTSEARATSRTGDVIAGTASDDRGYLQFIFIWTGPGQVRELWNPEEDSWAFEGMSPDGGTIAATVSTDLFHHPMRWTEEEGWQQPLRDGKPFYGFATDAADDGTVVGFIGKLPRPVQAFRWSPLSEAIVLATPDGFVNTGAQVVTPDGRVVFGWSERGALPDYLTRWTFDGRAQMLGAMMAEGGKISSVEVVASNSDGNTAVGTWNESGTGGNEPAFIWNARDGIRDLREVLVSDYGLDVGELRVKGPFFMSEDGRRIVGTEKFSGKPSQAWRVTLPAYCRPDCNADSALTINDFLCFQARWRAQDIYGDFNNDAKFNINDFIAFQAEWRRVRDGGGCE